MPESGVVFRREFCSLGLILFRAGEVLYGVIWEGLWLGWDPVVLTHLSIVTSPIVSSQVGHTLPASGSFSQLPNPLSKMPMKRCLFVKHGST